MTSQQLPPKVYVRGAIGKTKELLQALTEHGAKNLMNYRFGDPDSIYYINRNWEIKKIDSKDDLYYFITNSDWTEIVPSKSKQIRKYILTIKEGSPSCDGCEYGRKCGVEMRDKCELGKWLAKVVNVPNLAGKTLNIEDVTDDKEPPTPLTKEDY